MSELKQVPSSEKRRLFLYICKLRIASPAALRVPKRKITHVVSCHRGANVEYLVDDLFRSLRRLIGPAGISMPGNYIDVLASARRKKLVHPLVVRCWPTSR